MVFRTLLRCQIRLLIRRVAPSLRRGGTLLLGRATLSLLRSPNLHLGGGRVTCGALVCAGGRNTFSFRHQYCYSFSRKVLSG